MSLILTPDEIAQAVNDYWGRRDVWDTPNEAETEPEAIAKAQAQHMGREFKQFWQDYYAPPSKMSATEFCKKYHLSVPKDMQFHVGNFWMVFDAWLKQEGVEL